MSDEWIDCKKELPPCDGIYWVTRQKYPPKIDTSKSIFGDGTMDYDGYGWQSGKGYCDDVTYWMQYRRKKYGKQ